MRGFLRKRAKLARSIHIMYTKGLGRKPLWAFPMNGGETYQMVPIMMVVEPVAYQFYYHEKAIHSVEIILQVFNPGLFWREKHTVSPSLLLINSHRKL